MDGKATTGKSGYFKVSMDAAIAIARATNSAELLAAYIVLCRHAFDGRGKNKSNRGHTAAGARSLRDCLGLTDYRSKRVLAQLRGEGFGPEGSGALFEPAGFDIGNAPAYVIRPWGERFAYLPSIFCDKSAGNDAPISKLLDGDSPDPLLFLLYAYEKAVYGDWFGCPPNSAVHQKWKASGEAFAGDHDLDLGHQGREAGFDFWLSEEPTDSAWYVSKEAGELFEEDASRVVGAVEALLSKTALVRVAYCHGQPSYPLWVFSPGYRDSLAELGINAELAKLAQRSANRNYIDADNRLISEASGLAGTSGTGLFYSVSKAGKGAQVYTLVTPRLHAPTPRNMDELEEARRVTQSIAKALQAT